MFVGGLILPTKRTNQGRSGHFAAERLYSSQEDRSPTEGSNVKINLRPGGQEGEFNGLRKGGGNRLGGEAPDRMGV